MGSLRIWQLKGCRYLNFFPTHYYDTISILGRGGEERLVLSFGKMQNDH